MWTLTFLAHWRRFYLVLDSVYACRNGDRCAEIGVGCSSWDTVLDHRRLKDSATAVVLWAYIWSCLISLIPRQLSTGWLRFGNVTVTSWQPKQDYWNAKSNAKLWGEWKERNWTRREALAKKSQIAEKLILSLQFRFFWPTREQTAAFFRWFVFLQKERTTQLTRKFSLAFLLVINKQCNYTELTLGL